MKTLADDTQVSARTYYYLLDFNERTEWQVTKRLFGAKRKLCSLNIYEYRRLFIHATDFDKDELDNIK
jgi:hypothetical protein